MVLKVCLLFTCAEGRATCFSHITQTSLFVGTIILSLQPITEWPRVNPYSSFAPILCFTFQRVCAKPCSSGNLPFVMSLILMIIIQDTYNDPRPGVCSLLWLYCYCNLANMCNMGGFCEQPDDAYWGQTIHVCLLAR